MYPMPEPLSPHNLRRPLCNCIKFFRAGSVPEQEHAILSFMKRTVFVLLLLLIPSLASSQPRIQFQTEQHDFGSIRPGSLPEFVFEVTNVGDQVLEILDVGTS